ncbi:MAG: hypothetical protein CCU26_19150 [Nitrospira sp. UW-LDO-01]|nr:MAG: hypothetical protein CCU26_19150 [Nitrospira sp. UW-LDO-01]
MTRVEKTVFISYRRTNAFIALAISQNLTQHGFDVFIDYQGIGSGDFEKIILENIRARAHFLVILTPSSLERCDTPGDWLRCEIEEALETKRNVVPLLLEGFDFGAPTIASKLTGKLAVVPRYNGMTISAEYFGAAMDRLREKFLNIPLDAVLHPASDFAQQAAKEQQVAAAAAPPVADSALTAEVWFERGFNSSDWDEKMRCYTEAIQLNPNDADAYTNRGNARAHKGDFDGAMQDYTEALRLQPDHADAYNNRGNARSSNGDFAGGMQDCTEAIRLKPDDADAYNSRGIMRVKMGDLDGAIEDSTEAIRLNHAYADAYGNRGCARLNKGDFEGAVQDCTEAIRLKPDTAIAYAYRGLARYNKGDLDAAVRDCTEAIRCSPDLAEAYNYRGEALQAKGDKRSAQEDFDKAKLLKNQH